MTQQELKEKLLAINLFEDNDYLNQYCGLIIQNLDTKKEKFKTHLHHITPRCYFLLINSPIDNSKENLVNLLYKDHILAHYYLFNCTLGELKQRLSNAMVRFYNETFEQDISVLGDLDKRQALYEECIEYVALLNKKNNSIPIQCLETGEVFESATQAEIQFVGHPTYNINASIKNLNNGINHTAYGYHWVSLKNRAPLSQEELQQQLNSLPSIKKSGTPIGTKRSKGAGELLSKKLKGKKKSQATIQAMKDAWNDPEKHKDRKRKIIPTPEEVEESLKLKELRKAQNSLAAAERNRQGKFHLGHHHTEEVKNNISSKTTKYKVQNLETGEIFLNTQSVDRYYAGKATQNAHQACKDVKNGIDRTAYGYHWIKIPIENPIYSPEEREIILKSLKSRKEINSYEC